MVAISSSIRRHWRDQDGTVGVFLDLGVSPPDALAVGESIAATLRQPHPDDRGESLWVEVQRVPKGAALAFVECSDLTLALDRLAAALTERGFADAKVRTLPVVRPLHGHGLCTGPEDEIGAARGYLALRGEPGPVRGFYRSWETPDEYAEAALADVLDWAIALPDAEDTAHLSLGRYYTPVELGALRTMMRVGIRRRDPEWTPISEAIVYAGDRFRSVAICPDWGIAVIVDGNEYATRFDWPSSVSAVTDVLRAAGDWCAYGHITRGFSSSSIGVLGPQHESLRADALLRDPAFDRRTDRLARLVVEEGDLFDAFGVMRLPTRFATEAAFEETWSVTPLPQVGAVLLEHRDPAAWFGAPQLDQPTLHAARAALAPFVLERGELPEFDTWLATQQQYAHHASIGFTSARYWAKR